MDEDVLVLRLHHVVPLGPHQRHVAVDVHRLLMLDALQHGVDDDEAASATHTSAVREEVEEEEEEEEGLGTRR